MHINSLNLFIFKTSHEKQPLTRLDETFGRVCFIVRLFLLIFTKKDQIKPKNQIVKSSFITSQQYRFSTRGLVESIIQTFQIAHSLCDNQGNVRLRAATRTFQIGSSY